MKKYLLVTNLSLQEYFVYRLNFILWRVRVVVSILISYFLWSTVYQNTKVIFGYGQSQMLTYILLTIFINGIVLSTQTSRVAEEINRGSLSNFLVRPIDYFSYNLSRDMADKIVNTFFSVFEFIILLVILNPPVVLQTNVYLLLLFALTAILAGILYFEISMLLSFIGFWSHETWAPRFLFFIIVAFLAGNYFPLDIVPPSIFKILEILPFTYLVFFPLKIYLGNVSTFFIIKGIITTGIWIVLLYLIMKWVWIRGLKTYTAVGQ